VTRGGMGDVCMANGCGFPKLGRGRASTWDEPSSASAQIPWGCVSSPDLISATGLLHSLCDLKRSGTPRVATHDARDARGARRIQIYTKNKINNASDRSGGPSSGLNVLSGS
jgi:hypothetical protein